MDEQQLDLHFNVPFTRAGMFSTSKRDYPVRIDFVLLSGRQNAVRDRTSLDWRIAFERHPYTWRRGYPPGCIYHQQGGHLVQRVENSAEESVRNRITS